MVNGRCCATVWRNGTWHTWDKRGHGGENSTEQYVSVERCPSSRACDNVTESVHRGDVPKAMVEAEAAVVRQGFHIGRTPATARTKKEQT